jgi:hypothetical protein
MSIPDRHGAARSERREGRVGEASRLMEEFAERTGIIAGRTQHRYLWTDAFAARPTGPHTRRGEA